MVSRIYGFKSGTFTDANGKKVSFGKVYIFNQLEDKEVVEGVTFGTFDIFRCSVDFVNANKNRFRLGEPVHVYFDRFGRVVSIEKL